MEKEKRKRKKEEKKRKEAEKELKDVKEHLEEGKEKRVLAERKLDVEVDDRRDEVSRGVAARLAAMGLQSPW